MRIPAKVVSTLRVPPATVSGHGGPGASGLISPSQASIWFRRILFARQLGDYGSHTTDGRVMFAIHGLHTLVAPRTLPFEPGGAFALGGGKLNHSGTARAFAINPLAKRRAEAHRRHTAAGRAGDVATPPPSRAITLFTFDAPGF